LTEGVATFAAKASEAVEEAAALVTVAAAALGGPRAAVVVKVDNTDAVTAATFAVEVGVAVAGVGRFAAAAIAVVLDGKATSAFPDNSIQKLFTSVRTATSARLSTLARYVIGREFWRVSRPGAAGTGSSQDKESPTLGKARAGYTVHAHVLCIDTC
jgi:hypothetical protein